MSEVWKDIPKFEGKYQISNLGNVRSLDRTIIASNGRKIRYSGKPIKKIVMADGYLGVSLGKKNRWKVHRLVLATFVAESDLHCDHINSDIKDNRLENLEYVTLSENNIRAWKNKKLKYMLGVSRAKNKFVAFKHINKKRHYLGVFETEQEAHNAYLNWEQYVKKNTSC